MARNRAMINSAASDPPSTPERLAQPTHPHHYWRMTMRIHLLVATALALSAAVTSANALTVTNNDKTNHTFLVVPQGGKAEKVVLKSKATGTYDCSKGCELRMGAFKSKYDADVEKLAIRGGKFMKL
jgi:hypothetical protein